MKKKIYIGEEIKIPTWEDWVKWAQEKTLIIDTNDDNNYFNQILKFIYVINEKNDVIFLNKFFHVRIHNKDFLETLLNCEFVNEKRPEEMEKLRTRKELCKILSPYINHWKHDFLCNAKNIMEFLEKKNLIVFDEPDDKVYITEDPIGNQHLYLHKFYLEMALHAFDIYPMDSPFGSSQYKVIEIEKKVKRSGDFRYFPEFTLPEKFSKKE